MNSRPSLQRVNTVFGRLGLVWLMVSQFAAPNVAMAETVTDSASVTAASSSSDVSISNSHLESVAPPMDLHLDSVVANLTAGELIQSSVNIQVGSSTQSVTGQTLVTPAQLVAIMQVVSSGSQSIVLGEAGNAIGGSLHLGHELLGNLGNVVIPEKVTAFRDFGLSSTLNLAGALTNYGTLYAVSTNAAVSSATIAAAGIYNQPGAIITSVLPSTNFAGYTNLVDNLSLTLCAVNDLVNSGLISSAGNLSVIAGGSVVNALPAGVSGAQPIMSAVQNLNIMSTVGNIVNSGALSASIGNVNLASAVTQNLMVSNIAGTIQALNGAINVRDIAFAGSADIDIVGGNLLAKEINLNAGGGSLNANLSEVLGTINTTGSYAHVSASTHNLHLGSIGINGDPVFFNSAGDITISGNIEVEEKLAIIASKNIVTTSGVNLIQARDAAGQGYDIHLIAGANVSGTGSTTEIFSTPPVTGNATGHVIISGVSSTGGNIDFSASENLKINASSTCSLCNGGNVVMAAYSNGSSGGQILLNSNTETNVGSAAGLSGNVTMIAGSTASLGTSVQTGKIIATGANVQQNFGKVTITTAQPTFSSGSSMTFAPDGSVSSGNELVPSSTIRNGSVSINNDILAGGVVSVRAGGHITSLYQTLDTMTVGDQPRGTVLNASGTRAYTVNMGSNTVSVINTLTSSVIATVAVGDTPTGVALNSTGSLAYVTNKNSGSVSVIDTANNTVVDTIEVGSSPNQIAVDQSGGFAYTANTGSNDVSVIDLQTNTIVAIIAVGDGPSGIALNSNGTRAYVANSQSNNVSVIDTDKRAIVHTIGGLTGNPEGIAISPDNRHVYITRPGAGNVAVYTTDQIPAFVTMITTGGSPTGVAFDATGASAYVTNAGSNRVDVVNTSTRQIVTASATGAMPESSSAFAGFVSGHARAYVANKLDNNVSVLQLASIQSADHIVLESTIGNIQVGLAPNSAIMASTQGNVAINGSGDTHIIGGSSNGTFSVGANGSVYTDGPISANKISLTAGSGDLVLSFAGDQTAVSEILLASVTGAVKLHSNLSVTGGGGLLSVVAASEITRPTRVFSASNIRLISTQSSVNLTGRDFTAGTILLDGRTGVSFADGRLNTNTLNLFGGSGNISVSDTGATILNASARGNISISDSATTSISLRSFESITGKIHVTSTSSGGNLKVDVPMSAMQIYLEAKSGNIVQSASSTIAGVDSVDLIAASGSLTLNAGVSATAPGTGKVSLVSGAGLQSDLSISKVSASKISAKSVSGAIVISAPVTADTSVSLEASGNISGTGGISTPQLSLLVTGSGAIDLTKLGSGSVSVTSPGAVRLDSLGSLSVSSSLSSSLTVGAVTSITITGNVGAANSVSLTAPLVTVQSGTAVTGGAVSIGGSGLTVLNNGTINASSTDINVTSAAGTNLYLQGTGSMNAKLAVNFAATAKAGESNGIFVSGTPTFAGDVAGIVAVVPPTAVAPPPPPPSGSGSGTDISGGGINTNASSGTGINGSVNLAISIINLSPPPSLIFSSAGANSVNLTTGNITQGPVNFSLGGGGATTEQKAVLVTNGVNFKTGGDGQFTTIQSGAKVTVNSTAAVNTGTFNIEAGASFGAKSIQAFSSSGKDLAINNMGLLSTSAGNLYLISSAGRDFAIGGGGTITAQGGLTHATALQSSGSANVVRFTTGGQTFNGDTAINALGLGQSVIVETGVTVQGNNTLAVNTGVLELQGTGRIFGNPLILTAPGAGTIRKSGNLDLASVSSLTFSGKSLAIVSSGSIINTGSARVIDLSHPTQTAGSLTLIAGFDFKTSTMDIFNPGGALSPSNGTVTLTGSTSGSIMLSNVSVVTNSSAPNQSSGSVLGVAKGSINIGSINTSANASSGTAGSVTLFGNGITVGTINTSGSYSGTVSLISGSVSTNGSIVIDNGVLMPGGAFTLLPFEGTISIGNINAGSGLIYMRTGNSGTYSQQFSTSLKTTGLLTVMSGTGSFSLTTEASNLALFTAGGNASIISKVAANLQSSEVDGVLSFQSTDVDTSVAAGATVIGTKGVSIQATNGGVIFGDGSVVRAGSLKQTAPAAPSALVTADIQQAGGIQIVANSAAGGLVFGANVKLQSNGADLTLSSTRAGADVTLGSGTVLEAHGGNLVVNSAGRAVLQPVGAAATLLARTLNGYSGGALSVAGNAGVILGNSTTTVGSGMTLTSSSGLVTVNAGVTNVGGVTNLNGNTGVVLSDNATINSGGNFNVNVASASGGLTLGNNVTVTAGSLNPSAPASPASLSLSDIKQSGTIYVLLQGTGGIKAGSGTTLTATGSGGLSLSSYGQNSQISFGDNTNLQANGGSLSIYAAGQVKIGASGGTGGVIRSRGVGGGGGSISISASNGLFIGDNVNVSAGGGMMLNNYGTGGSFSVGAGTTIAASGFMFLSSYGSASSMSFGANSVVRAGSIVGPYTPGSPVSLSQIGSSGSIYLYAYGNALTIGNNAIMEANGGSLSLNAYGTSSLQVGDGAQLRANGGSLTIYGTNPVSLGTVGGSGVQLSASTMSGGGGFLTITGTNGLLVGANSRITAGGALFLYNYGSTGSLNIDDNSVLSGSGFMTFFNYGTGDLRIGNNAQVLVSNGSVSLSKYTPGSITVGNGATLSATNGGVTIYGSGNVVLGSLAGLGVNVSATGAAGMISLTGSNGLLIGAGSNINASGFLNVSNYGTTGELRIGNGASLRGGPGITLAAYGGTSSVQIGSGVQLSAGTFAAGPQPAFPASLTYTSIAQAGSISITGYGNSASNVGVSIGDGASIVSRGGNITVSSYTSSGDISVGDGYNLSALGGGITFSSGSNRNTALTVGVSGGNTAGSRIVTQGSGGYGGSLTVNTPGGVRFGSGTMTIAGTTSVMASGSTAFDGTVVQGLQTFSVTSTGGVSITGGSTIASHGNLTLSASGAGANVLVGNNTSLTAGLLAPNTASTGLLQSSQILASASVIVTAPNVTIQNGATLTSNGNDLVITATSGGLSIGSNNKFVANGGNLALLAQGQINGAGDNQFYARGVGGSFFSSGGGIQLGSGVTFSGISSAFFAAPNTNPAAGALGAGVIYTGNNGGIIKSNVTGGGAVNLNAGAGGPSTLQLNRGAILFDAQGTGARVNIDHGSFQTESFRPIAMVTEVHANDLANTKRLLRIFKDSNGNSELVVGDRSGRFRLFRGDGSASSIIQVGFESLQQDCKDLAQVHAAPYSSFVHHKDGHLQLRRGEIFLDSKSDLRVQTDHASVSVQKGGLVTIRAENECTYVRVCSAVGSVSAVVNGQLIALRAGEEVLLSDSLPTDEQLQPADGIGRRRATTRPIGSMYATFSDFSIVSALAHSDSAQDKQVLGRMLKTAATIDMVLKHRGAYKAKARGR